MRITDRSRHEEWFKCPRKRYWAYEYQGRGLVKDGPPPVDLAYGLAFHEGAEVLVKGGTLNGALDAARRWTSQIDGITVDGHPRSDEYYALAYGHLRSFAEVFLPKLLSRYEILVAEDELTLPISDQLLQLIRVDLGVRDKESGLIYNLEYKTDGYPSDIHTRMEYYIQMLLESKALSVQLGEYVAGSIIVGVDKGSHKGPGGRDIAAGFTSGERRLTPFTYAYTNGSEWRVEYCQNKGWYRVPVWLNPGSVKWYEWLVEQDYPFMEQFVETPPILFDEERYEDARQQIQEIEFKLSQYQGDYPNTERTQYFTTRQQLNRYFPQNFLNCKNDSGFKKSCPFIDLCFGAGGQAPLEWGYKFRVPNHPLEEALHHGGSGPENVPSG